MLAKDKALLIVCKAINPFVTSNLLIDDKTIDPGAPALRIADLFFNLNEQDKKFGTHVVDDILDNLVEGCRNEKFDLVMGKAELVKGLYLTVDELAETLTTDSTPRP